MKCNYCDIGEGDKCLTCRAHWGCATCNPGYILFEEYCIPFYIEAKYETTKDNETIYLIYNEYRDVSMYIMFNDSKENLTNNQYIFGNKGIHSVTLLSPKIDSLVGLFENNEYLISASIINEGEIVSLERTFAWAKNLESTNISNINTKKLSSFQNIFKDCHSLKSVIFPKYYYYLRQLNGMFQNCYSLSSIDFSNVTIDNRFSILMNNIFENCSNLEDITFENSKINNINNISSMFRGCSSLKEVNVSNLGFAQIFSNRTINYMFYNCPSLTLIDISSIKI